MATLEQDFEKDLAKMQDLLNRLKREYDLYFAGSRKDPPYKESRELETLVRKWRTANLSKLAMTFRLQTFLSSYTTQTEMWNKWFRQKEEGYARDPRLVAVVRRGREAMRELDRGHLEPEPTVPEPAAPQGPLAEPAPKTRREEKATGQKSNGSVRKLYDEFLNAKMAMGEIPDVDFAAFERKLGKQREDITRKYEGHEVLFSVVTKDGKVSLKAKVVKSRTPEP
jgi:hypothetical protein